MTPVLLLVALSIQTVNDDRDVVQTALLSFFHHEDWHSSDWTPKGHVVLRTQFESKERTPFAAWFDDVVRAQADSLAGCGEQLKNRSLNAEQRRLLERDLRRARQDGLALTEAKEHLTHGPSYQPPGLVPLESMAWDPRIIVSDDTNRPMLGGKRNLKLEEWTVYAWSSRPSYSRNGRYAFVRFHIPWSIHSSSVTFLLERKGGRWMRVLVQPVFYV